MRPGVALVQSEAAGGSELTLRVENRPVEAERRLGENNVEIEQVPDGMSVWQRRRVYFASEISEGGAEKPAIW